MHLRIRHVLGLILAGGLAQFAGCGDSGSSGTTGGGTGAGGPDQTGASCQTPSDCYPGVDPMEIQGTVACLDELRDGYCTHSCTADTDCCAAEGECKAEIALVCSPFESMSGTNCFLSCEEADLVPAPGETEVTDQAYCQREAGRDFICRSSGGGNQNRKICVPGDCGVGAACEVTADCAADLECVTDFGGGYCGKAGCTTNAECPTDSLCIQHTDDVGYCFRTCVDAADCTLCRGYEDTTACTDDVTYLQAGSVGTVCVPN